MGRLSKESFVTTLDYPDHAEFLNRSRILSAGNGTSVIDKLKFVMEILRAAKGTRALLLDSSSHSNLLASICLGFYSKSRRPVVVMAEDMWQKDSGLQGLIQKIILRLADRAIFRYAPLSTEEFPLFSAAWGLPENKLRFLPYFYTFTEKDLSAPPPPLENFIFAGGNAHRDYLPLIKAIENLPEYEFVIASHLLDGMSLPPNVKAKQVPRPEFIRLMRASRAVIVPIRKDLVRSTGHQTYLNGMLLRKPTIITNTLGVHEYTLNGKNAIIVDGSAEGYVQAIRKVMDPANNLQIEAMCKTAQESVLREYSFENHCKRLLEILDEAIDDYYSTKP